ncbi:MULTISPECIES: tetratricopeptide repeat protein [unclassified Streptomyces]|uniref:tetratricopeptide repeat protein n=1 Tax=unclassified Streptomyces TaxID=2593676 RepID=UPI00336AC0F8
MGAREEFATRFTRLLGLAGEPTLDSVAENAMRRRDATARPTTDKRISGKRISDWKRGESVPQSREELGPVIRHLIDLAHRNGVPQSELLDESAWLRHWKAARAAPKNSATPSQLGQPLGDDPFALGVHAAIGIGDERTSPLPPYVQRDHDAELAEIVASAGSRSAMAVLVGDSSTGKTRALWEAIQKLPESWLLWHPGMPTRPQALLDGLTEKTIEPRTVVWLNETQHYLDSARGEQVAVALSELLHDPKRGPVLVLGTFWREHFDLLTRTPSARDDPHHEARRLLDNVHVLRVPEAFSTAEIDQAAAVDDPRLALAAQASGGCVTQFLAGVPELLRRYELAPAIARAVLDAAIDIRRLGHGPDIASTLLEEAAYELLDERTRSSLRPMWITEALDYTSAPCRGVPGALVPTRPGQPHHRLSDIIEQEGRRSRALVVPSHPLWEVFRRHADADGLARLGDAAQARGLFREASLCYMATVREGHQRAAWSLASMLERSGRIPEAIDWYRRCAESGSDKDAYARVACLTYWHDVNEEESIRWLRRHIDSNAETDTAATEAALEALAYLLEDRRDELNAVLKHHYGVDDETELRELGDRLAYAIDEPDAVGYWDDDELHIGSRMSGPNPFIFWIGDPLVHEGRIDEAIRHYQSFSDESTYAMRQAVKLLEQADRPDEAIGWLRQELRSGNEKALWIMAELLQRLGRDPEAKRLRTYGVEPDDGIARAWTVAPPRRGSLEPTGTPTPRSLS